MFKIDATTGLLSVNKILSFERQAVHEIVVVATDGGEVPQETSAFITVRLTPSDGSSVPSLPTSLPTSRPSSSSSLNTIDLDYLDKNVNGVPERAQAGQPFAKLIGKNGLSLTSSDEVTLTSQLFAVIKNAKGFFLATRGPLDYEKQSSHNLLLKIRKNGRQTQEAAVVVEVADTNEHSPVFEVTSYKTSISESVSIGTSVISAQAEDQDDGKSGLVSYSLRYSDSSENN